MKTIIQAMCFGAALWLAAGAAILATGCGYGGYIEVPPYTGIVEVDADHLPPSRKDHAVANARAAMGDRFIDPIPEIVVRATEWWTMPDNSVRGGGYYGEYRADGSMHLWIEVGPSFFALAHELNHHWWYTVKTPGDCNPGHVGWDTDGFAEIEADYQKRQQQ